MLTKEDLGQIREVVSDVVHPAILASEKRVIKTIIEAVGQMIDDNISPQFDAIYEEVKEIKQDMGIMKQDIRVLKQEMSIVKQDIGEIKQDMRSMNAKLVTKGGLEDRLTDFRLSLSGTPA